MRGGRRNGNAMPYFIEVGLLPSLGNRSENEKSIGA